MSRLVIVLDVDVDATRTDPHEVADLVLLDEAGTFEPGESFVSDVLAGHRIEGTFVSAEWED